MIIAFEAEAKTTSDSLIPPTPEEIMFTTTSSVDKSVKEREIASADP